MNEKEKHRLILYLESLAGETALDRGALAKLRRALYDPLEAYPVILPYLPENVSEYELNLYALLAALFSINPHTAPDGNMGAHMRLAAGEQIEATERRFVNVLRANAEDLPVLLRQSVSYLRSKDVAVNWEQLRRNLLAWNDAERYVQKNWARSFWGFVPKTDEVENKKNEENK